MILWVLGLDMDGDFEMDEDIWHDCFENLAECELEEVDPVWDHDMREGAYLHEAKLLAMVS